MDKFIIVGVCENCGELKGRLKAASAPMAGFPSNHIYTKDTILYHVHPIMTKAKINCND